MATVIIDGVELKIGDKESINAIQAAERAGIAIPYYCYHPALSVVANCRMCEVEVGQKDPRTGEIKMQPRLIPGCQTPARDGTVLVTQSEKVKKHQRMIMEYLLINHPLDCPVCDQAGECGLQDYSFHYGSALKRFVEARIVNPKKDVGRHVLLFADRCIMCTRCVRFAREITHTAELEVVQRGNHAEIETFPGLQLDNPMSLNVVDLCPVGALLSKDFLYRQRVWFLKPHPSICTRCSTGCNVLIDENRDTVWRLRPRWNPQVNDYWMCDIGRLGYHYVNDPRRLNRPLRRGAAGAGAADGRGQAAAGAGQAGQAGPVARPESSDFALHPIDWASLIPAVRDALGRVVAAHGGAALAAVVSPFLSCEEAYLLARFIKQLAPDATLALGPVPVEGQDRTFAPDKHTGRGGGNVSFIVPRPFTIHAERCPNRRGVEAVLAALQGQVIGFDGLMARVAAGHFKGLYLTGGSPEPWITQDQADTLGGRLDLLICQDIFPSAAAERADFVIPGTSWAEKDGSYVNVQGILQQTTRAIAPVGEARPDGRIFAELLGRRGLYYAPDVLRDLARAVPAFAAVTAETLPEHGLALTLVPGPAS